MEEREGPEARSITAHFCDGCKWLDRRLTKAKRAGKPEYQSNCNHPTEMARLEGELWGRFIGEGTKTPWWCPVMKEAGEDV